jgi:hypothetical protein
MVLKYMAKYCITITNTYICRKHTTGWITVVQFPGGAGTFLVYATTSRPALGPSQPPNQGVPGVLSTAVKQPEHKADHSPLSSAEVRKCGDTPPLSHVFMSQYLVKHRDNFTFILPPKRKEKSKENFLPI